MSASTDEQRTQAAETRRTSETHRVIKGRSWRISDPALAEPIRQHLVDELMDARRAVKDARRNGDDSARTARDRVQDAKVALGERGPKWWEPTTEADDTRRIDSFVRAIGDRLDDLDSTAARMHLRLD